MQDVNDTSLWFAVQVKHNHEMAVSSLLRRQGLEEFLPLQEQTAMVQLVPYHSTDFKLPQRIVKKLRSTRLSLSFVQDILVPRAQRGECLLVAARAQAKWQLPNHENILNYTNPEARGAHFTPKSRGGAALLQFLQNVYMQK